MNTEQEYNFVSFDPATGEEVWRGKEASTKEVDAAILTAQHAFEKWRKTPLEERVNHLEKFRNLLQAEKSPFAEAISKETGKPLWESQAEVDAMIGKVAISIQAHRERSGKKEQELPHTLLVTHHRPHGVVVVLGPFNFPGHLPNGHIIPALLAGNTVVFKPSDKTPLVGELMAKIWKESGLPKGIFNIVQGGSAVGKLLAEHQGIHALFFTGSWNVGKQLSELFGRTPQKMLALEMGGNNPLVMGKTVSFDAAAHLAIQSAYLTAGQRCSCARRLIVLDGKNGDNFLDVLIQQITRIKIGPYTDRPEPFMGPVISEEQADFLLQKQEDLLGRGAKSLVMMKKLKNGTGLVSPALIDVTGVDKREDEEIFGPFLQVIRVSNFDEAMKEANNTEYGLSAGLFSDDPAEWAQFSEEIQAGIINWNQALTGASSAAPFGGVGKSGNHRPSAYYATDYCSYPVASMQKTKLETKE